MQTKNTIMFSEGYFNLGKRCLFSKGQRALGKQVMPFYLILVTCAFVFLYMENSSLKNIFLVILSLLALPILVVSLTMIGLVIRAKSSKKKELSIEKNKVIIRTKSGKIKSFSSLHIKYFDGCFIDFTDKNNLFDNHALFGDEEFLNKVIDELKLNGFEVFKISDQKIF